MGRYFINAVVLTLSGLILRALGMVFRVVLAGKIGSEGMGLYQLVLTVYNVSASLATAGLTVAAATMTARQENLGKPSGPVIRRLAGIALALGLTAAGLQLGLAGPAARYWLGDARAALALRLLAPSLPFMGLAAVWRGYFLAKRQVTPNVVSQLVEQAVRLSLVFWLLDRASGLGLGAACGAVTLGTTISEGVSCGIIRLWYGRQQPDRQPKEKAYDRELWRIILPMQGDKCLSSALHAAENALVPICLMVYLGNRAQAVSQYGALRGMAMPVVLFPFSFLAALSTLLLPEITAAYTKGQYKTIRHLIDRTMVLTTAISLLAGGVCTLCGGKAAELLYHDPLVGLYLTAIGPMVPFMYIEGMIDGILNGLGEQTAGLRYSVADSLLRIAGVVLLLPRYGMKGFLVMMAASNCMTCYLNVHRMLVVAKMKMCWWKWVFRPGLCLGVAIGAAFWLDAALGWTGVWQELLLVGTMCGVYLPLAWLAGVGKAAGEIKKEKNQKRC